MPQRIPQKDITKLCPPGILERAQALHEEGTYSAQIKEQISGDLEDIKRYEHYRMKGLADLHRLHVMDSAEALLKAGILK